jgi:hypothetical protein
MNINPGDKLEILLVHKGIPFAKTWIFKHDQDIESFSLMAKRMARELYRDIEEDEREEKLSEGIQISKESPQGHDGVEGRKPSFWKRWTGG